MPYPTPSEHTCGNSNALRPWTPAELSLTDDYIYAGRGLKAAARKLGRTVEAVRSARIRWGRTNKSPRLRDRVRELHAGGQATTQIAKALGCKTSTVIYHLRRHGLAGNTQTPQAREYLKESGRRRYAHACRTLGVSSLGARAAVCGRMAAFLAGWPAGTSAAHGRVLGALREHGPLTVAGLCAALDRVYKRGRCRIYETLREMRSRQLVAIHHLSRKGSRGSAPIVVSIHPELVRRLGRARSES
jgi:hypothetical protein